MTARYVTAEGRRFRVGSEVVSKNSDLVWVVEDVTPFTFGRGKMLLVHLKDRPGVGNAFRSSQVEKVAR